MFIAARYGYISNVLITVQLGLDRGLQYVENCFCFMIRLFSRESY